MRDAPKVFRLLKKAKAETHMWTVMPKKLRLRDWVLNRDHATRKQPRNRHKGNTPNIFGDAIGEITSIGSPRWAKDELNRFKVHPRETYEDVIKRLMREVKRRGKTPTGA